MVIQDFNTQIRDVIIPKYNNLGNPVIFVDPYSNFVDAHGNIVHLGPDGVPRARQLAKIVDDSHSSHII